MITLFFKPETYLTYQVAIGYKTTLLIEALKEEKVSSYLVNEAMLKIG